jgi:hypothetical protein
MEDKKKNSTWIQRLCENDPDLRCAEHDQMSFLLAAGETIKRLCLDAGIAFPNALIEDIETPEVTGIQVESYLEHPITKGKGEYQVIIGFADALCKIKISGVGVQEFYKRNCNTETYKEKGGFVKEFCLLIEAKPTIINPMEVLRQLKTYRQFISPNTKLLLWCPTITQNVAAIFRGQKIYVSRTKLADIE